MGFVVGVRAIQQMTGYGGSKRPSPLLCRIIVLSRCRGRQYNMTVCIYRIIALSPHNDNTTVCIYHIIAFRIVGGDNTNIRQRRGDGLFEPPYWIDRNGEV